MGRWFRENEQERIISALKIGLILCSTKESADYLYKFLITASLIAQGKNIELSSLPVTIKRYLTQGNSFEVWQYICPNVFAEERELPIFAVSGILLAQRG
mgnify:CR=1 FL=1